VLNFHGYSSNASRQMILTGLVSAADEAGVIAVHPDGFDASWNAGKCCGTAASEDRDHVGYVRALLASLESTLCVDTRRVYSTGMSNGGFLSHRLGCELSDRIVAIAPVAGVIGISDCAPVRPVPVLHIHGTDDSLVPYEGGGFLDFPSVMATVAGWASRDRCADAGDAITYAQGEVTCQGWQRCDAGSTVTLCTVEGGGHTWPGGTPVPVLGHTTTDLDATRAALAFFALHALP
jgi:polyhydroxybutyrate depolymerase